VSRCRLVIPRVVVSNVVPTQPAQNRRNQRPSALVRADFRLWEQEVPGGDSHRTQERAAFGMKAPGGAFNARSGAPTKKQVAGS
jgi:hypothetical protein